MDQSQILKYYTDPKNPGSFSSINKLYRALKGKATLKDIKKALKSNETFLRFKLSKKNKKTGRYITSKKFHNFQWTSLRS